jgi:catechol 2,3-dioxygenase-like lactoylglutathione lyase family enzyme
VQHLIKAKLPFENMITEIAFTGTPVTDIKRAREFYEGVLGLKPAMESAEGKFGITRQLSFTEA